MKSIAPYPLAALCGLSMIIALFLSWVAVTNEQAALLGGIGTPDGSSGVILSPINVLDVPGFDAEAVLKDPMGIAVAVSLVLAAAVAVLGFLGGAVPRLFAIIAGIAPFAIIGWAYFQLRAQPPEGFSVPTISEIGGFNGIYEAFLAMTPSLGYGIYAYFGGAILLLLLGLFAPSKSDAYDY